MAVVGVKDMGDRSVVFLGEPCSVVAEAVDCFGLVFFELLVSVAFELLTIVVVGLFVIVGD